MGGEPPATQQLDGLDRHHAVRTATVGHHVTVLRYLLQSFRQFRNGDRAGPRDVPRLVLLDRTNVEHRDLAAAHAAHQLVARDGLERAPSLEVLARHALDFGEPRPGQRSQRDEEVCDLLVREPVLHIEALLPGVDQACGAQDLQVLRRVADRDAGEAGQHLDGAWPLGKQVEQLQPLRGRGRLADPGDLLVDLVLELPLGPGHAPSILVFTRINNGWPVLQSTVAARSPPTLQKVLLEQRVIVPVG